MAARPDANDAVLARRPLTFGMALTPIVVAVVMLILSHGLFGDQGMHGPHQVGIACAIMVATFIGWRCGFSLDEMSEAATASLAAGAGIIFSLLAVGALLGTWAMSGTLLAMGYYLMYVLDPHYLYVAAALIAAVVGFSISSAWTVASTIGVGLVGITQQMGLDPTITAGAVVSGAYFGDKASPRSSKTKLAVVTADVGLREHLREALWTSVPAFALALVLFWMLGERGEFDPSRVSMVIHDRLNITPFILLPFFVVLVLALLRWPPFTTMFIGALTGGVVAVLGAPERVIAFAGSDDLIAPLALLKGVWMSMASGYVSSTGVASIDAFLTRGGMAYMLSIVWLIIVAQAFGGIIERIGLLQRLLSPLVAAARSTGSLVSTVVGSAILTNVFTASQYVAIGQPERMCKRAFEQRGLAPVMLSRTVADSATVTSVLIPWNSCGAYVAAALGVATFSYAPYAFFNLLSPLITIAFTFAGLRVLRGSATTSNTQS